MRPPTYIRTWMRVLKETWVCPMTTDTFATSLGIAYAHRVGFDPQRAQRQHGLTVELQCGLKVSRPR